MSGYRLRYALCAALFAGSAALGSGACALPEDDGDLTDTGMNEQGQAPEEDVGEASQELNGAGQCCHGMCSNGYHFSNGAVVQDCRAWVVNTCHSMGFTFNPYGDAWWQYGC